MQQSRKKPNSSERPWFRKGLLNACKIKNMIYKEFIKHRTREKEIKYKRCQNRLIDIIRKCKKDYFNKVLEKNKDNISGTWNVINSIIRNRKTSSSFVITPAQ